MFKLPFKHKGIMAAPFVGAVSIRDYLPAGQIEQVIAGGENYDGSRPLEYEWVKTLYDECVAADVTFVLSKPVPILSRTAKPGTCPTNAGRVMQPGVRGCNIREKR